jgi:hypothetical protein
MSDTAEKVAPTTLAQDAWVSKFTGVEARRGPVTIGGHRAASPEQPTTPTPEPTPWQSAKPSDPNAPQMAQPRDQKLAEVDGALKELETAANAIGAPLLRTAVEPDIARVKEGREALANAADRGEVAKQLANVPALLQDIATVKLAAEKDKADGETLAAKALEVGNALVDLNKAADGIGQPLGRTQIAPAIDEVTQAHAAMAKAATREQVAQQVAGAPALLQKIAEVKQAAEKDKTDGELHVTKVIEVNAALKTANEAADAIGAPLARAAVDQAIKDAETKRDTLASAATRDAIDTQLKAAPALLNEIEQARLAAAKDKADCEALAEKTRVADEALKQLNSAADGIGAPLARTAVQGEIDPLAQALAGLGKATTRDALAKEIETAEGLPARIAEVGKSVEKDKQAGLALAAEKEKVRLALEAVETAAGLIGAPLLRTAIDPQINTVKQEAEKLNTAATRDAISQQVAAAPTLLGEIEKVRLAAVKDKEDGEKLATALQAVDNAIGPMTNAFNALNPVCKKEVQVDIDKVAKGRDDLSKAATRDVIGTQLAAQPQLLLDIAAAQQKAVNTLADWNGLQVRKAKADKDAGTIKNIMSWIPGGSTKNAFNNDLADLKQAIVDLDSAGTLQKYKDDLAAVELTVTTMTKNATDAATPPWADKKLEDMKKWLPVFKPIADPNPVSKDYDALLLRKNSAASGGGDVTANLTAVAQDIIAATDQAKAAYAADQFLLRTLQTARGNANAITSPTDKSTMLSFVSQIETRRTNFYSTETTASGLASKLNGQKGVADQVRAATAGIGPMTAAIQSALTDADVAIKQLPSGVSPRNELTVTYTNLTSRLATVGSTADYWARQAELVALQKAALKLVADARGATFQAKASTTTGQGEIDSLINGYGSPTDDPVQQQVIKAAIKASYGVDLEIPEGMSMKTIKQLYEAIRMVPKSHLQGLTKINYETDPLINTSYYGGKEVTLNKIGSGTSEYDLTNQGNPTQKERVNYFTFTALHEFGHYVDDANSVMKDNGKGTGFGKWEEETLDSVVDALYTASFATLTTVRPPPITTPPPTSGGTGGTGGTGGGTSGTQTQPQQPPPPPPPTEPDLKQLIRTLLEKGAANKPASATGALGSLFHAWDTDIKDKDGWKKCLAIRDSDSSPWDNPTEVTAGRYFHEGYPGQWYSYDKGERSSGGISHYQFRSPVEWFAEQYAFYRMKPTATKPTALASYLTM